MICILANYFDIEKLRWVLHKKHDTSFNDTLNIALGVTIINLTASFRAKRCNMFSFSLSIVLGNLWQILLKCIKSKDILDYLWLCSAAQPDKTPSSANPIFFSAGIKHLTTA